MSLIIKKIWHRDANRIGIFFDFKSEIKTEIKKLNAKYSATHKCWYLDYNKEAYALLKGKFSDIIIDKSTSTTAQTLPVTGNNRDNSPIATGKIQLDASQMRNPEHTAIEISFAQKMRLQLLEPLGKYWIFKMHYHHIISKQLLKIKGVYWNANYKAYMVLRHPNVKTSVEALLETAPFFGQDYLQNDIVFEGQKIRIAPHFENPIWMEIYLPKIHAIHQKIKRFSMARYSKTKDCYLLPAAPIVYDSIQLQMEPLKILIQNELSSLYLQNKNLPNKKSIALGKAKQNIFDKVPEQGKIYVSTMIDTLMALNYSCATLQTYCGAFIQFLKHFEYKNPDGITQIEITKFLASLMERGLSATTGHSMVNALQFYYQQVLGKNGFELKIPRPKKEKKLPVVLTMDECLSIFKVVDNQKHKLLLLIGYGAGLRVSEIVNLQWADILINEHKIHLKNAKGKKDRFVMLPYSIVQSLEIYKQTNKGTQYVFEGQFANEPYSTRSAQIVMNNALKKSGLEKKATVHTLRHSFATHLLENGTDIRYIQQFLGHANIKTTTIYTHLTKTAVDRIQSPLDRMVEENRKKIEKRINN